MHVVNAVNVAPAKIKFTHTRLYACLCDVSSFTIQILQIQSKFENVNSSEALEEPNVFLILSNNLKWYIPQKLVNFLLFFLCLSIIDHAFPPKKIKFVPFKNTSINHTN